MSEFTGPPPAFRAFLAKHALETPREYPLDQETVAALPVPRLLCMRADFIPMPPCCGHVGACPCCQALPAEVRGQLPRAV